MKETFESSAILLWERQIFQIMWNFFWDLIAIQVGGFDLPIWKDMQMPWDFIVWLSVHKPWFDLYSVVGSET
jgi:hypothetical protein